MIKNIKDLIREVQNHLDQWDKRINPWFRGESNGQCPLFPKIGEYDSIFENYFLQSFRRKAAGLANVPPRQGHTDLWLFLAQHYGVPTRLLDWTEGLLHALYFAINRAEKDPKIFMLNPHKLNELAGTSSDKLNYPLTWVKGKIGSIYIGLAWEHRKINKKLINDHSINIDIPLAFPATYHDSRMFSQRSCFTIHGRSLLPLEVILSNEKVNKSEYLVEYKIDIEAKNSLLKELSILGVSASTIFPDLDHLALDLETEVKRFHELDIHKNLNNNITNKHITIKVDDSSTS